MVPAESANWAGLTCCGLLCGLTVALALGILLFLRGRGAAALPLLQMLFDRNDRQDDALDLRNPPGAPVNRPDLRAIAREHDLDAALQAQQGESPFPPELPSTGLSTASPYSAARQRDEEEEWGADDEPF